MIHNNKSALSGGFVLAAALMLGACGGKGQETVPAVTNNASAPSVPASAANGSAFNAGSYNEQDEQNEMERHHRQGMDHDEMRRGGRGPETPAPDQQPSNQSAPMQHM